MVGYGMKFYPLVVDSDYEISKSGIVRNIWRKKPLRTWLMKAGYYRTAIGITRNIQKHYFIHRLLAINFIPNPHNKPQINHKNGIKTDNRLKNLEWATHTENVRHAYKNKLNVCKFGQDSHASKLTKTQVIEIRRLLQSRKLSQNEIGKRYKVSRSCILAIHLNKSWRSIGTKEGNEVPKESAG